MHELDKIKEAKYFLSQILHEKENFENFKYNLSAFISSARSVLQYALEEAKIKNGGQLWYDGQIKGTKMAKSFRDKRDINIHKEPVSAKQEIDIMASETIHVSDSIFIEIRDSEGKINGQHNSKQEHPKLFVNEPTTIKARYRFDDGEDVFASCEMYLNELETIVMDGKSKGFLT